MDWELLENYLSGSTVKNFVNWNVSSHIMKNTLLQQD